MRSIVFLSFGLLFIGQLALAQKAKYHGEIVYRFSKHIDWSNFNADYKFVIGVVGNGRDFQHFLQLAAQRNQIKDAPVEVRFYACTDKIDECDLIYISEDCKIEIDKIVKKTRNEPILIVSGKDGYGQSGAVINFVEQEGKIKFELNQDQAEQRGLKVSDELKKIAVLI